MSMVARLLRLPESESIRQDAGQVRQDAGQVNDVA